MKMVSSGLIVAAFVYASNAVQVDVAGSMDGDDFLNEAGAGVEKQVQVRRRHRREGGPLFDRLKGLVTKNRNTSLQANSKESPATKTKASMAVLAKEASAKAKGELRKLFGRSSQNAKGSGQHRQNTAGTTSASMSWALGVQEAEANRSRSVLRANTTHRAALAGRRGNATVRHSNASRRTNASRHTNVSARKALVRSKYETSPEPPVRMAASPGSRLAQAVGDPHMTNIKGQRFDLAKTGSHALVVIPRFARLVSDTLLRVDAEVAKVGMSCEDVYIHALNVTGTWVTTSATQDGMHFRAGVKSKLEGQWWHLGKVQLKVVEGVTQGGNPYLNFFVRNLGRTGLAIGGLLGDDDHTAAATPSKGCVRVIALLAHSADSGVVEKLGTARSRAHASLN